jgi:4'-phosphopantetheinyl transferase
MIHTAYLGHETRLPIAEWRMLLQRLPAGVQARVRRFRRWQDAQATVFGRLMLEQLAKQKLGIFVEQSRIAVSEYGRPYYPPLPALDFNISHTAGLVACAVAWEVRIGIDVEYKSPVDLNEFRRVFTPAEYALLQQETVPTGLFYRLWTRKEAVMKADGRGLSLDPASFDALGMACVVGETPYTTVEEPVGPAHSAHLAMAEPRPVHRSVYLPADLFA